MDKYFHDKLFNMILLIILSLALFSCATPTDYKNKTLASKSDQIILPGYANGNLTIDFIDVGQGSSTLLTCPNGDLVLVDLGGSSDRYNDVKKYIDGKLNNKGGLDTLVISHADADHYRWVSELLKNYKVKHLILGGKKIEYNSDFNNWVANQVKMGMTKKLFKQGDKKTLGISDGWKCGSKQNQPKVSATLLAANVKQGNKNESSIVLKVEYNNKSLIITGDAGHTTENWILEQWKNNLGFLKATILILGHHGSANSSSQKWLETVNANNYIASAGQHGYYKHPRCSLIKRIIDTNYSGKALGNVNNHDALCGKEEIGLNCKSISNDGKWCIFSTTKAIWTTNYTGNISASF